MNKEFQEQLTLTSKILNNINTNLALEYALWTKNKADIKFNKTLPNFPITNNYIYWCDLGVNIGSEQNKVRPVIIAKTKKDSPICTVLPLTSERLNNSRWYHIDLEATHSTVLIEQLRNISKLRILSPFRAKGQLVKISVNDWNKINIAMQNYYSLTKWQ